VKFPDLKRLLHTTAVRTALGYAFLYILLAGSALGAYYWATSHYVDAQLYAGLQNDFTDLRDIAASDGFDVLRQEVASRSHAAGRNGRYYLLVDSALHKVAGNLIGWPTEEDDQVIFDKSVHVSWIDDGMIAGAGEEDDAYWPVIGKRFEDGSILLVARSVAQAEEMQMFSIYALSSLLFVIVVLALAMGIFMGRKILGRIDHINVIAHKIMQGDLSRRMPLSGRGDEFDDLSTQLNDMLARIEQLMQGMREVTDNVAHDLRRPLTRLRNRLDVLLLEERSPEVYRKTIAEAVQDSEDLIKTFNTVLQITQAEVGTLPVAMGDVELAEVAIQMVEFYQPVAQQKNLRLVVDAKALLSVRGNRDLLSQALGNLLDNAIKYTPAGGLIRVQVEDLPTGVSISVADNGPGIPAGERDRVLERFSRLDQTRSSPGNGLGLSLVKAISRLHGAKLILADNLPGLVVRMVFTKQETQGQVKDKPPPK
jgi:signal transduction histidine kinase